ncbi:hypothetical protein K3G63_12990 [Hymenobacter sp. HSC-4F20]|uniref:hypothetical protein n=1 Tax=Hymenobacter sp. HSC-4F20 TaxID=2864135 RepID=UPI001C73756F|nr:hypothetical protein [Hymenobacter sp. HSC-4F20]MBX0291362.1 hypothetical protein [Hymenobacter sp. HSC-4F20]
MLKPVRILPTFFILALTASCQKDKEMPEPTVAPPVQEANVSFTYTYPGENKGQTFLAYAPTGKLSSDKLTLVFEKEARPNGLGTEERVDFLLPKSKHKNGLVGMYTLSSQPDPGQGDMLVTYERPPYAPGVFLNKYSGNTHVVEGSFIITEYNVGRQLISGSYIFTIRNTKDPYVYLATGSGADVRRDCTIKGYGTFKEIPLL